MKILIAEDNKTYQEISVMMLDLLGHEAKAVPNGEEALRELAHQTYDVVLLDLNMPVMDGLETARRIRADFPAEHQPYLISITASTRSSLKEECLAAGMDDFIPKPFNSSELTVALEKSQSPRPVITSTPTDKAAQSTPKKDVIDQTALENLLKLVPPATMPDLIAEFIKDAKELINHISLALEAGNREELRRAAHTLGSTSAQFGAVNLEAIARHIEQLAESDQIEGVNQFIPSLHTEYNNCSPVLEKIRQSYQN